METAPNYAHPRVSLNAIERGASFFVITVASQPASETAHPLRGAPKREFRDRMRRPTLSLLTATVALAISGCLGPPVLERQVLGYDEVTKTLDEKLLVLNIARVSNNEPVHFTSTSSIAATFNWTTTLGASGEVTEKGTNFLNLNLGGSASENPTFSQFAHDTGWTAVDPKQPLVDACAFDASCPIPVIAYSRSRGLLGQGRSPRYLVPAQRPPGDAPNVPHRSVTS